MWRCRYDLKRNRHTPVLLFPLASAASLKRTLQRAPGAADTLGLGAAPAQPGRTFLIPHKSAHNGRGRAARGIRARCHDGEWDRVVGAHICCAALVRSSHARPVPSSPYLQGHTVNVETVEGVRLSGVLTSSTTPEAYVLRFPVFAVRDSRGGGRHDLGRLRTANTTLRALPGLTPLLQPDSTFKGEGVEPDGEYVVPLAKLSRLHASNVNEATAGGFTDAEIAQRNTRAWQAFGARALGALDAPRRAASRRTLLRLSTPPLLGPGLHRHRSSAMMPVALPRVNAPCRRPG
jgi:hypothetical protein